MLFISAKQNKTGSFHLLSLPREKYGRLLTRVRPRVTLRHTAKWRNHPEKELLEEHQHYQHRDVLLNGGEAAEPVPFIINFSLKYSKRCLTSSAGSLQDKGTNTLFLFHYSFMQVTVLSLLFCPSQYRIKSLGRFHTLVSTKGTWIQTDLWNITILLLWNITILCIMCPHLHPVQTNTSCFYTHKNMQE